MAQGNRSVGAGGAIEAKTRINTIDAQVAGEPVRLIVGGGPSVPGASMPEKLAWLRKHGERLRQLLMLEPRGHAGMHGALLTEPVSPNAHAGVLFMHGAGFPTLSGEGVIGAVTIALEHGLIAGAGEELLLDTPAGLVPTARRGCDATVRKRGERVDDRSSRRLSIPPACLSSWARGR